MADEYDHVGLGARGHHQLGGEVLGAEVEALERRNFDPGILELRLDALQQGLRQFIGAGNDRGLLRLAAQRLLDERRGDRRRARENAIEYVPGEGLTDLGRGSDDVVAGHLRFAQIVGGRGGPRAARSQNQGKDSAVLDQLLYRSYALRRGLRPLELQADLATIDAAVRVDLVHGERHAVAGAKPDPAGGAGQRTESADQDLLLFDAGFGGGRMWK